MRLVITKEKMTKKETHLLFDILKTKDVHWLIAVEAHLRKVEPSYSWNMRMSGSPFRAECIIDQIYKSDKEGNFEPKQWLCDLLNGDIEIEWYNPFKGLSPKEWIIENNIDIEDLLVMEQKCKKIFEGEDND